MPLRHRSLVALFLLSLVFASGAAPAAGEAEQLRIIGLMSAELRGRIEKLPVLVLADHPIGEVLEQTLSLNRDPVVIEGQRFDGVVITAPSTKTSFGWALVAPANLASWYILRERGDMNGFRDFVRRPKARLPQAQSLLPESTGDVTFQRLDSRALSPGERYILWFRFKDDAPAEFSVRAAFFASGTLNNNRLPDLLLAKPTGTPAP